MLRKSITKKITREIFNTKAEFRNGKGQVKVIKKWTRKLRYLAIDK